jgi:methylase of polypeptide subunit release factors
LLNLISPSNAKRLRDFFLETGYAEENLRLKLGLKDLPSSRLRNFARLNDRTSEPSPINTLLRWFWIGAPQGASAAKKHLPPWFIPLVLECGLLRQEGEDLFSEAMLFPADGFIFAADHTCKIDSADPELVLWPNPTSRLLSRFTVRRPSRTTLDLGTGNGVQALTAAAHSEKVVATDLSRRAAAFAAFNARLNGIENVECLVGDGFEPVAGRKFDLIVSNPPFFITPSAQYLFCDNPLDLDQLCRRLAREAPSHLNEDGYFQMLCEWAEVRGQPWQERLTEWLDNTGCDAWVMKGYAEDPAEYAEERIRSTTAAPAQDAELFASYMTYYRERQVEAIHGGVIAMHRRSGHNWILIEEVDHAPKAQFGESVLQTFTARDFLQSHTSDEQLLGLRPKLSMDARLEQIFQPTEDGWKRESLTLRLVKGFQYFLGLQSIVAEFLSGCDGTRTLAQLIGDFATKVNAPCEQVQKECLDVVRKLIERGFLLC